MALIGIIEIYTTSNATDSLVIILHYSTALMVMIAITSVAM